jgi:hypothetical protein
VSNRTEASRIAHATGLISLTTVPGEELVAEGSVPEDNLRASLG